MKILVLFACILGPAVVFSEGNPRLSERILTIAGYDHCATLSTKDRSRQSNGGEYIVEKSVKIPSTPFVNARITYSKLSKRMVRLVLSSETMKPMSMNEGVDIAKKLVEWIKTQVGDKANVSEVMIPDGTCWSLRPFARVKTSANSQQTVSIEWCLKNYTDVELTKTGKKRKMPVAKGVFEYRLFYEDSYCRRRDGLNLNFKPELSADDGDKSGVSADNVVGRTMSPEALVRFEKLTGIFGKKLGDKLEIPAGTKPREDGVYYFMPAKKFRTFDKYCFQTTKDGVIFRISASSSDKSENIAIVKLALEKKFGNEMSELITNSYILQSDPRGDNGRNLMLTGGDTIRIVLWDDYLKTSGESLEADASVDAL